jgi:hypothetical protein
VSLGLRTLGVLQWLGLLGGVAVVTAVHLVGFSVTQAECNAPGQSRGILNDPWMIALAAAGGVVILAAAAASAIVFLRTRGAEYGDGPIEPPGSAPQEPRGRLHFFSAAALVANLVFLVIVLLDAVGATFNVVCRQS